MHMHNEHKPKTTHNLDSTRLTFCILLNFSLSVEAATLIFISGCGLAISSAKEGKLGCIYNLVKR